MWGGLGCCGCALRLGRGRVSTCCRLVKPKPCLSLAGWPQWRKPAAMSASACPARPMSSAWSKPRFFDTAVAITPQDEEFVTVRWQGQARRINDQVVNWLPDPGRGPLQGGQQQRPDPGHVGGHAKPNCLWPRPTACAPRSSWNGVRPEWFDFTDPQPSAEDAKIERAFAQCDAFLTQPKAWGTQKSTRPRFAL